jgi:hypothetical protein
LQQLKPTAPRRRNIRQLDGQHDEEDDEDELFDDEDDEDEAEEDDDGGDIIAAAAAASKVSFRYLKNWQSINR